MLIGGLLAFASGVLRKARCMDVEAIFVVSSDAAFHCPDNYPRSNEIPPNIRSHPCTNNK